MAISFGTQGNNNFTVTAGDDYEEYRGMGGNDTYTVNPNLTEDVRIQDSSGSNVVVLGEAVIAGSRFFSSGVELTYASGGVLQILGDMSSFSFVFGGGSDPFNPQEGGFANDFEATMTAFGVDPSQVQGMDVVSGIAGTINDDGTVDELDQVTMSIDQGHYSESPVEIDASLGSFVFTDDATVGNNVEISGFALDDVIQVSNASDGDYFFSHDGDDMRISYVADGDTVNVVTLIGVMNSEDVVGETEAAFEAYIGFNAFQLV
ncbi:hypothetical protein MTBBW1_2200001 [Desulfamplus magnetovallimortis]|uniref:Uncharacterized protein n=1 Tax=Desulfamplus magnetovallimortis TaxID=1246637 RepID=A0A1W1HCX5_9BACT|nr:hypothetical protein [Desulfamplus magnetovallimortis]SLM30347.1 hypothetical protein MTBBW1_2200001 [Desulfamplus magnetovallimortis]